MNSINRNQIKRLTKATADPRKTGTQEAKKEPDLLAMRTTRYRA